MQSVGQRFLALRKELKLTQAEIASKINVAQSFLSLVESDKGIPGGEMLISVNRYYDADITWLLTGEGEMFRGHVKSKSSTHSPAENKSTPASDTIVEQRFARIERRLEELGEKVELRLVNSEQPNNIVELPYFIEPAAAGAPVMVFGDDVQRIVIDKAFVKRPSKCFAVRCKGDSMTGSGIESGDILVIERERDMEHGKIVLARLGSADFTIKKLDLKNSITRLLPTNPDHKPIILTESNEVMLVGVVVLILRQP